MIASGIDLDHGLNAALPVAKDSKGVEDLCEHRQAMVAVNVEGVIHNREIVITDLVRVSRRLFSFNKQKRIGKDKKINVYCKCRKWQNSVVNFVACTVINE